MLKNMVKHFITITKHKIEVFKLCVKAGIPFRGLMHDLSKYSFSEFFESAKYYKGTYSPIIESRKTQGYSKAWLHHKGRNKHHHEYWYDYRTKEGTPIIPYKYVVEMICDSLAAGKVYKGKKWTNSTQLEYWYENKEKSLMNQKIKNLLTDVYVAVSKEGIDKVIKPNVLKELYNKNVKINLIKKH